MATWRTNIFLYQINTKYYILLVYNTSKGSVAQKRLRTYDLKRVAGVLWGLEKT